MSSPLISDYDLHVMSCLYEFEESTCMSFTREPKENEIDLAYVGCFLIWTPQGREWFNKIYEESQYLQETIHQGTVDISIVGEEEYKEYLRLKHPNARVFNVHNTDEKCAGADSINEWFRWWKQNRAGIHKNYGISCRHFKEFMD